MFNRFFGESCFLFWRSKRFFGELLGIKSQPLTVNQQQFEELRKELGRVSKEEEGLRQEKETAERAVQTAKEENALLQTQLAVQQKEIERLHEIEAQANVEHEQHVAADKLAAAQLEEIEKLTKQIIKAQADVTDKEGEIKEKIKEADRKTKKENKAKVLAQVAPLRQQLADMQAKSDRLALEHQQALQQERQRQAEKDQAKFKTEKAQLEREKAEEEHKRIEAEHKLQQQTQELAVEKSRTVALEHEKAVQARELLETRYKAEKDKALKVDQAEKIADLEQQLREKTEEAAIEHTRHYQVERQLEEEKKTHFITEVKNINDNPATETELLAYISDPSAFFNSPSVIYQAFKEKVKADDAFGPVYDLAVSHIMMHSKTPDIKDYWTKFIVAMPTPSSYRGDNVPLKLVAILHETLKDKTHSDPIVDAYSALLENTLANGGCFGIDFERSATDDELRVMIPALRLSGTRAISKITTLDEALKIILSAYWHIKYLAAPLQDGEDIIFESHRRNTTLAAVQVLKKTYNEDEILDGLEKADVVTNTSRAYAKDMWAYYDQFDK